MDIESFKSLVKDKIVPMPIEAYTISRSNREWSCAQVIEQCFRHIISRIGKTTSIFESNHTDRIQTTTVRLQDMGFTAWDGREGKGAYRIDSKGNDSIIICACDSNGVRYSGNTVYETFIHELVHWLDYRYFNEPVTDCLEHRYEFEERCEILGNHLKGK